MSQGFPERQIRIAIVFLYHSAYLKEERKTLVYKASFIEHAVMHNDIKAKQIESTNKRGEN